MHLLVSPLCLRWAAPLHRDNIGDRACWVQHWHGCKDREAQRPGPALARFSEQRKRAPVSLALAPTTGSSWVVPHMLLLSPNDPQSCINRAVRACSALWGTNKVPGGF